MTQLNRERLENLLQHNDETSSSANAEMWEVKEMARRLLAVEGQEPVAYMYRDKLHADARFSLEPRFGNWSPEDINEYEITETKLYAAPPAPVAQDPVGIVRAVNALGGMTGLHVSLYEKLPVGTEVYAAPQPVAVPFCPKCGDTGMTDSGGVQPWGEPIEIPCDCRSAPQPAPVAQPLRVPDDLLSAMEEVLRISDRDHEAWKRAREGIAACRAAMLKGN